MNKLDQNIIDKVYKFEIKRTLKKIIIFLVLFVVSLSIGIISYQFIYNSLSEKRTFDVLQIFQEDFEVIKIYFGDAVSTIFHDLPKRHFILFVLSLITFVVLIFVFLKTFKVLKRRLSAILKHWQKNK